MDAKKATLDKIGALKLAAGATKIIGTKGQKIIEYDLTKSMPSAEELTALVVGPSGNLRAPTARIGGTLLVGFNAEMYAHALK